MTRSRAFVAALLITLGSLACVDPLTTRPVSTPEWTVKNTKGYGETVVGLPPDVAYGWDLRVAGGVARWRECTSRDTCGEIERERPAAELLGFKPVGRSAIGSDAGEVEVLELALSPRPKYVVPVTKP